MQVPEIDGDVASGRVSLGPWDVHAHLGGCGDRRLVPNVPHGVREGGA